MTDLVQPNFKTAKKKPKTPTKTQQLRKADELFGKFIRSRGACENCGDTYVIQCAHGFSRSYRAVRFEPANAWALCRACHMHYTHRPLEWDEWMRQRLGPNLYETLRQRALHDPNPDLGDVIKRFAAVVEGAA